MASLVLRSSSAVDKIIAGIFTDDNQINTQQLSIVGLLYQAGINVAIGAGAFILFVILRPNNARVYARRYKHLKDSRRPPKIGKGYLSWIPILWKTDEKYMLENVGIDSVFFLRFLKLGTILMGIFTILGMFIIVPVNFTQGNIDNVKPNLKEFKLWWLTLFHVTELEIFWLHLGAAYLFTAIVAFFIWREVKYYIKVKQDYFASEKYQRLLQSRTIMITRVPGDIQTNDALASFVTDRTSSLPPAQTSISRKLGQLPKLISDHEKLLRKLERVLYKYLASDINTSPRPTVKVSGQQVDAIEHYTSEIEAIEETIDNVRRENHSFKPTSVGFVSYSSPLTAHESLRMLKRKRISPMVATLAPHPKDIIWSNAQMPKPVRVLRLWSARLISIVFCFVAFWPVAALTFIADATNIQALWPETAVFFLRHDTLTTIWQTTFSPLILALFYIAIPHVFRIISRYQGIPTSTAVERSVFKKMYVFYFLCNIVVITLVGFIVRISFDNTHQQNLGDLPSQFIKSINQKSQFWTAYVSLKGMNAMLEFAQLISLIMIFFKRYTRDLTPRELRDLTQPPDFDYSPVYSLYLWIFTVSMLYSVYAPITMPFAFLDFVLAYWVYKYAIMYVYQTRHETAGAMWRSVINRMLVSMIFFQVYLIGCLKTRIDEFIDRPDEMKKAQIIVYALIPLPAFTLCALVFVKFWVNPRVNYIRHTVEAESLAAHKVNTRGSDTDSSAGESLGDRFLHPIFSQPLMTPIVDRRVRHLLPKVYRGRTSVVPDAKPFAAPSYNQDSFESKESGATIAMPMNTGKSFGSAMDDLDSVMDARDRRDFDGVSSSLSNRSDYAGARRYSIDSDATNGEMVELLHIGGRRHAGRAAIISPTSSRADLLANTRFANSASASPDFSDDDLYNPLAQGAAPVGSTLRRFESGSSGNNDGGFLKLSIGANGNNAGSRDTFDPIELYGDRAEINEHLQRTAHPPAADANNPYGSSYLESSRQNIQPRPMHTQYQNYAPRPGPPRPGPPRPGPPRPGPPRPGPPRPGPPSQHMHQPRPRPTVALGPRLMRPMGPPRPNRPPAPPQHQVPGQQFGYRPMQPRPPHPPNEHLRRAPKWD